MQGYMTLSLWEWSPAGHVVRAFVDVNQWKAQEDKKKSPGPTDRIRPSSPALTHSASA